MKVVHSGKIGDVIYACCAFQEIWKVTGEQIDLRLRNGVLMGASRLETLIPLLALQPYIGSVEMLEDMEEDYDAVVMDDFRFQGRLGDNLVARQARFLGIKDVRIESMVAEPWISVPRSLNFTAFGSFDCVINRTSAYHGVPGSVWRRFVELFDGSMVFIGPQVEHRTFEIECGVNIRWMLPADMLEVAQVLDCTGSVANGGVFAGNQSACWALACAMRRPARRILEVCPRQPDCMFPGIEQLRIEMDVTLEPASLERSQ